MKARQSAAKKEKDAGAAYDAGMKAYDAKDYLTAQKELRAARTRRRLRRFLRRTANCAAGWRRSTRP